MPALRKKFKTNHDPLPISLSQALLLVIKEYKNKLKSVKHSTEKKELKKSIHELYGLYLSGKVDSEANERISIYLKEKCLANYEVSQLAEVINEDPSRRFFETNLSYYLLVHKLDLLSLEDLQAQIAHQIIECQIVMPGEFYEFLLKVINGRLNEVDVQKLTDAHAEYYMAIKELKNFSLQEQNNLLKSKIEKVKLAIIQGIESFLNNGKDLVNINRLMELKKTLQELTNLLESLNNLDRFSMFTLEHRKKLIILAQLIYTCFMLVLFANENMPLNIYDTGYFSNELRGRVIKSTQEEVKSFYFGTMKCYMPVPRNARAFAGSPSVRVRPADNYNYDIGSNLIKKHFALGVHPFSASISGTLLMFLRVAKYLNDNDNLFFKNDQFKTLLQVIIAFLLFNSGGHSLHEFASVLKIKEIVKAFTNILDQNLTTEMVFFETNSAIFDKAITETIEYNDTLLKKAKVQAEIRQFSGPLPFFAESKLILKNNTSVISLNLKKVS